MLSKSQRIPREMFPLLQDGTKILKNRLFLLKWVPFKQASRFSFSISKKVAKSAVERNRLRRAGYRILAKRLSDVKLSVLAAISFKAVPKDDRDMEDELDSILKQAKIIK